MREKTDISRLEVWIPGVFAYNSIKHELESEKPKIHKFLGGLTGIVLDFAILTPVRIGCIYAGYRISEYLFSR